MWSFCFLFCGLFLSPTIGQESPALHFNLIGDNVTFRNNVCDRQKKFQNLQAKHRDPLLLNNASSGLVEGDILELEDALSGLEISVLLRTGGRYFNLTENGTINETNPGFIPQVLDEVAKRGNFTWRDSYGVAKGVTDWKEFLEWGVDAFDVHAEWWVQTPQRLKDRVLFPEGYLDASFVLVATTTNQNAFNVLQGFKTFLKPLTDTVWICIIAVIVISSTILGLIERTSTRSQQQKNQNKSFLGPLYGCCMVTMQHVQVSLFTVGGKILCLSLAFWSLLIVSAYTANLASFFVIENTLSPSTIQSIEGAVALNTKICVWKGTSYDDFVEKKYPNGNYIRIDANNSQHYYDFGLKTDTCPYSIFTQADLKTLRVGCDVALVQVGKVLQSQEAGFAIRPHTEFCTSLVEDVFNYHLTEMKLEGKIDALWNDFVEEYSECPSLTNTDVDSNVDNTNAIRLGVQQMCGIFIFHAALTLIAILMTYLPLVWKTRKDVANLVTNQTVQSPEMNPNVPEQTLSAKHKQNLSDERKQSNLNQRKRGTGKVLGAYDQLDSVKTMDPKQLATNHETLVQDMQLVLTQLKTLNQNYQVSKTSSEFS
eukprot:CAMPEP_0178910596 /NCGR_PEP_ID=MMETSP0786-20121207/9184_1 /TAXON_ID=186022 /ORGANISM="Thalassionema frauenfeldii, Strain CCMP 1798" /LENGTH=595 /DNA_ID=CAMNT_0020582863 /DNA_START=106 /DNA_END=1889 /DNA_ORIENTATION=+